MGARESGNRGFVGDWVPTVRCCGPGQGYQARPEAENARTPAWNAGDTVPEQPLLGLVSTEPGTSRLGMGASSNSGLHGLLRNTAPPENSVGALCCRVLCTGWMRLRLRALWQGPSLLNRERSYRFLVTTDASQARSSIQAPYPTPATRGQ